MLILRLLFILSAISIVLLGGLYLFTSDRRFLVLAWQIAKFVLFAFLIIILLFVLERYVLIGWRILL
jgi:hypothetical protein